MNTSLIILSKIIVHKPRGVTYRSKTSGQTTSNNVLGLEEPSVKGLESSPKNIRLLTEGTCKE